MEKQQFRITLVTQRSATPVMNRIRSLLKYALRVCGLRCVEVIEVTEPTAGEPLANPLANGSPTKRRE